MHTATEHHDVSEERRDDEATVALPATTVPPFARRFVSDFGWRHVRTVAVIRYLVAVWLVILGSILCATVSLWGATIFIAAGVHIWLAYRMPQWKRALEAEKDTRVRELRRSRALVVDDAAARLARIEQDLHDGAQAQMVAVVMKLGLARDQLLTMGAGASAPGELQRVLELVEAARGGAGEAIAELRDLARGIHPPVLGEGLEVALNALAERSEVPVEVVVDLPERPSPAIETIAYFCAAELLTNAAKHSAAHHVTLRAKHQQGRLRLQVRDDGRGGARIYAGGGLAGLVDRVGAVDGTLRVDSPAGGPTTVTVELPSHA